eukprot:Skav205023  [mRNA]  locus=scaffold1026:348466:349393:- [translate_table: standard]
MVIPTMASSAQLKCFGNKLSKVSCNVSSLFQGGNMEMETAEFPGGSEELGRHKESCRLKKSVTSIWLPSTVTVYLPFMGRRDRKQAALGGNSVRAQGVGLEGQGNLKVHQFSLLCDAMAESSDLEQLVPKPPSERHSGWFVALGLVAVGTVALVLKRTGRTGHGKLSDLDTVELSS